MMRGTMNIKHADVFAAQEVTPLQLHKLRSVCA